MFRLYSETAVPIVTELTRIMTDGKKIAASDIGYFYFRRNNNQPFIMLNSARAVASSEIIINVRGQLCGPYGLLKCNIHTCGSYAHCLHIYLIQYYKLF